MQTVFKRLALFLLLAATTHPGLRAQSTGTCEPSIGEAYLDIGNVRARITNNGNLFWRGSPHVYNVPKGGTANAIFAAGLWIGGMVDGALHLAGSTYGPYEFWAGPLDEAGRPPADCSSFDRVFRVSKADVRSYEETLRATPDLLDWPTGLGAPTLDASGAPIDVMHLPLAQRVDRVIDLEAGERPDFTGDQMLWWVMNDAGNVHNRTDTPAIGLEVHVTAYAFLGTSVLGNSTFYSYRIFNRSSRSLTDAYAGMFADADLGNFHDDYVGSDSLLGLAFTYNADNHDEGGEGYGAAPPAVGFDYLQVPEPQNEFGDGEGLLRSEPKRMGSFMFYNGGAGVTGDPSNGRDMYNLMQARWKDGQRATFGGNGRDFSNIPVSYIFPSDPPDFWSEFSPERGASALAPADRRFASASTPFDLEPGAETRLTIGVISSFGSDNLDSVKRLKEDSRIVQALFDSGYEMAEPPAAPNVTVSVRDREALLQWNYREGDNNYLDAYVAEDPTLSVRLEDRHYRFEGYNVYRFTSPGDTDGKLIAVYDLPNGITSVAEGELLTYYTARGTDSGVRHHHRVGGLDNYRSYYFGVQAYAYGPNSGHKILKGPVTRVEVVPASVASNLNQAGEDFLRQSADNMAVGLGSLSAIAAETNIGRAVVSANVVSDVGFVGDRYSITAVSPPDSANEGLESQPSLSFVVRRSDGTTAFDGLAEPLSGSGLGIDVLRFDGLSLNVDAPKAGLSSIEVISNNAGPLSEPVGAAPTWLGYPGPPAQQNGRQQSTTQATWVLVTGQSRLCPDGDCGAYESFLERSILDFGGWDEVLPYDWEIRFTERQSYAWEPWTVEAAVEVPFELWRTGIGTPDDPSDDVRFIPVLNDLDMNGLFNLVLSDHPASPEADDPFTDWFYWHKPQDESPGDGGYLDWLAAALGGDGETYGSAVMGRHALMSWDGAIGGSIFGGDMTGWMVEPGTTFRIKSRTGIYPGDQFTLNASALLAPEEVALRRPPIGITPNPYKGSSEYEVSSLTEEVRFTNMPREAMIRVYQVGGALVRTMRKNSPEQYFRWNLRTDENLPIASGMYLIHIESDEGDETLKFGVVKKQPLLSTF